MRRDIVSLGGSFPQKTTPPPSLSGSAFWMDAELAYSKGLYESRGILFARGALGLLRYPTKKRLDIGEGHAIVCAPSRSGKGISFVIPNLLTWNGPAFVIDPKGENCHFTADRRRSRAQVFVIDPCRITGQPRAGFNPIEWLIDSHNFDEDLMLIVEALTPQNRNTDPFWNQGGRDLLSALICYLVANPSEKKTLGRVYEIVNSSKDKWEATLLQMQSCGGGSRKLNDKVRAKANWYASLHEDHKKYHMGTVQYHLSWLEVDSAREMLEYSSFDLRNFKRDGFTLYVCIPPLSLSTFEGLTRLLTSMTVSAVMARLSVGNEPPSLFMLDEFATTVGKLRVFDDAFTSISGYGGRFAVILQSLDQLQGLYPEGQGIHSWKTILENSGLQLYFNARGETAKYISTQLGETTDVKLAPVGGSERVNVPLLYPHQVSFPVDASGKHVPDAVFAFVEGLPPIRAKRLCSYLDQEFVSLHNPNLPIQEVITLGLTEGQKAVTCEVPEELEDENRKPQPKPPEFTETDIAKLKSISDWDDFSPVEKNLKKSDALDFQLQLKLSQMYGQHILKDSSGRYGYLAGDGKFVVVLEP